MEIEDLMIEDWVSYHGIANKVAPADFCHFEWIDEIKPIPITPEILEKNGLMLSYLALNVRIGYQKNNSRKLGIMRKKLSGNCIVDRMTRIE